MRRGRGNCVSPQHWGTFVRNHAQAMVACDFCVVVIVTFKRLYVFVVPQNDTPSPDGAHGDIILGPAEALSQISIWRRVRIESSSVWLRIGRGRESMVSFAWCASRGVGLGRTVWGIKSRGPTIMGIKPST
jgi:hypothetical protein